MWRQVIKICNDLKGQCDWRKPFKFCYDFTGCEIIIFWILLIFHVSSRWCFVACVHIGFAKTAVDGKEPILCNINIIRMEKIAMWIDFSLIILFLFSYSNTTKPFLSTLLLAYCWLFTMMHLRKLYSLLS